MSAITVENLNHTYWTFERKQGLKNSIRDLFGIASPAMQKVCAFLPYQYIFYVPLQILERRASPSAMAGQIVCALALFLLSRLVWKGGLKRYEAAGV